MDSPLKQIVCRNFPLMPIADRVVGTKRVLHKWKAAAQWFISLTLKGSWIRELFPQY
ncbi:unnamed protein product [Nezara viridula]|uniref:Uncharacterized protein n=1 Tax=Nezara viridula TaxID=85310 RepID=A0A9P0HE34_NEZVI|nr:unnamed protein product [Nezara viridula]